MNKVKQKTIFINPVKISLWSIGGMVAYTIVYMLFDTTNKYDLFEHELYFWALAPILLFSIGISFGIVGAYTKNISQLFFTSILLGAILFAIAGYLFYILDGIVLYARY